MPAFSSAFMTVAICILIILAACYLAVKRFSWLSRNKAPLVAAVTVLGIIIYSIGYLPSLQTGGEPLGNVGAALKAIFSTGRMFVLENDYGELNELTQAEEWYGIAFGSVMVLAMLVMVMVVLSFFGFGFLSSLRIRVLRLFGTRKPVHILTDISERTLALARSIKENDARSIIIFTGSREGLDQEKENPLMRNVAMLDNAYLHTFAGPEPGVLADFCIFRSMAKTNVHYIALSDDLVRNTRLTLALAHRLADAPLKSGVTLHVLTDSILFGSLFSAANLSGINLVPLDRNALAADDLLLRAPLLCSSRARLHDGLAEGELSVAMIGNSPVVPFLYQNIITQGQFYALKLRIFNFSCAASDTGALFLAENPEAERYSSLEWIDVQPGSAAFFNLFRERCANLDIVVCAGESDEENIRLANVLRHIARDAGMKMRVCARVRAKEYHEVLAGNGTTDDIVTFGSDLPLEDAEIVINERLDHMAKAVHQYYCKAYSGGKPWRQLSIYERESSRALAMHIPMKLCTLHLTLKENPDGSSPSKSNPYDELLSGRPDVLENLAIGEHMRWNAYLATHGWTQLPLDDVFSRQDVASKRHPCLVPWEDLARISRLAGRDYQELDRQLIRSLASIAADGNMRIEKADD
jgi:hypothetical protein